MEQEIWKDIVGYEGIYKVSNLGIIKRNEHTLKYSKDHSGYYYVNLSKNGKVKLFRVHRIVAKAFISTIDNKYEINHKNGNKLDNRATNLEWVSHKENMIHAVKNNLLSKETLLKLSKIGVEKNSKPVAQIKNGVIIATYKSTLEARRITKIINVSRVANGERKQAGGYQWKYIEKGI